MITKEYGLTEALVRTVPEQPGHVSFEVVSDRGLASAGPPLGDIRFMENTANPTRAVVDLETGRITSGTWTLLVSSKLAKKIPVSAAITQGQIVFKPHGFQRYDVFASGTLVSEFPFFGSLAFLVDEGCSSKADNLCGTVQVRPGDPRCRLGGIACQIEGGKCAISGRQGTCTTVVFAAGCQRCSCK